MGRYLEPGERLKPGAYVTADGRLFLPDPPYDGRVEDFPFFVDVRFVREGAQLPRRFHEDEDAGFDLYMVGEWTLLPGVITDVPLGIATAPAPGWYFTITHRSSTPKRGIDVIDGTIDNGFRGEWLARVRNTSDQPIDIPHGDRIVQAIPHRIHRAEWRVVERLAESARGENGFGSTGVGR